MSKFGTLFKTTKGYLPSFRSFILMGILSYLFILPEPLASQNSAIEKLQLPKTPRRYYTQANYQRLLQLDPEMARRRGMWEIHARSMNVSDLPKEVTIPVVVHILYKIGTPTKDLISENDVKQQLDMLTKDFRQTVKIEKHEADKKEKFSDHNALDTRISFCLASKDPSGQTTKGVLTIPTSITTWAADDKMKSAATGGSTTWDAQKYLNIWVVNLPDDVSGYAQLPLGPAATDGIVIDTRYFGKKPTTDKTFPYTEGKTLTHLIGNYFNLNDIWSETVPCGDDGVEDTPIHNAPNYGYLGYRHVSTCEGNPVEMCMNFMDNTNDSELYMFTNGQKKRMQSCLVKDGIRYKLVESGETLCKNNNQAQALERVDIQNTNTAPPPYFSYRIYPNPATDNINLEIGSEQEGEAEFTVFNAQGSVQLTQLYRVNEGNQQFSVNSGAWSSGLYFIRLKIKDHVVTQRVIINH
jgi:hypothetical protein